MFAFQYKKHLLLNTYELNSSFMGESKVNTLVVSLLSKSYFSVLIKHNIEMFYLQS